MKSKMIIILSLFLLSVLGCSKDKGAIGGSGLIEADEVVISTEANGQVIQLNFDEGFQVKLGDTLLIIDPTKLELQLKSSKAGYDVGSARLKASKIQAEQSVSSAAYAKSERERVAALVQSGSATQKQLDQLEYELSQASLAREAAAANVATAQAELSKWDADIQSIERKLQDCYPESPLTGVILEKLVEQGELLASSKPIGRIARLDTVWVKVYLASGDFAKVKVGDQASINTEAGQTTYGGNVVWTSQEAEFTPKNVQTEKSRANLVYAVKIKIPNTDGLLKIGMPVYVSIGN